MGERKGKEEEDEDDMAGAGEIAGGGGGGMERKGWGGREEQIRPITILLEPRVLLSVLEWRNH
jgi:hypothetical protein